MFALCQITLFILGLYNSCIFVCLISLDLDSFSSNHNPVILGRLLCFSEVKFPSSVT